MKASLRAPRPQVFKVSPGAARPLRQVSAEAEYRDVQWRLRGDKSQQAKELIAEVRQQFDLLQRMSPVAMYGAIDAQA